MPLSQAERTLTLTTTLGADALLVQGMTATERLSAPFEYELDLVSERFDLNALNLLGTPATVTLVLPAGGQRYFNGCLSRFVHCGWDDTGARYRATLVPWLWFLSWRTDCRIFQDQTVPDIVAAVFRNHGFTDFEQRLSGSYRPWTYCVQYRESDLNFVSRLLEHEGIYYFHEHTEDKHLLVLADSRSAHAAAPGYASVPYYPPSQVQVRAEERIDDWTLVNAVRPGAFAHTAFDFTAPRKDLLVRRSAPKAHAHGGLEVFDYQGDYTENGAGDDYARIRLEEAQAGYAVAQATGDARGLACGGLFTLSGYPRADQNREYLIVAAHYTLSSDTFRGGGAAPSGPSYRVDFSAIDAQVPYRPARATPKPTVQGPQTARVVGKAGEEIWTDKHGRVKVQFHWDRYGTGDETSSCWVRVSHPWAGKGWGAVAIPRIGQEVIVDFLEGDPDQPIITGRVYNGTNMPPYGLPAAAVISGLQSRTKGGDGYNEYVMDDTKGNELIREHGQYDKDSTIEHDLREHVLHDRSRDVTNNETVQVGNDRSKSIGKNETTTVGVNRTETVGSNETITIGANRTENVGAHEVLSVALTRTHSVGVNDMLNVGAAQEVTVGAAQAVSVGGVQAISVGGARVVTVGSSETVTIGRNLTVTAADSITLTTGEASITMKKDGTITIKGKDITIKGSGGIQVKASKDVVIKGSKIAEN